MTPRLLVSVVTPSYNQAQFLEETILSVLNQSYPRVEYHVMDGGSTDGSVGILKKYSDRMASWVSEKDKGQADAINRGWRKSSGDILAYLNADDQYKPGAIAAAAGYFEKHPEAGIVYGSCGSFFTGQPEERTYSPPEFSLKRLLFENFIPQPTVFIRRQVLDKIGVLDLSLRYCLDYDLWLRAAAHGIVFGRVEGPPMARFRLWTGSKTSSDPEGWAKERLQVLEQLFSDNSVFEKLQPLKKYAQARGYVTVAYSANLCGDSGLARRYLRKAFSTTPAIVRDSQFWRVGGGSLLGGTASRRLRRWAWSLKGQG